MGLTEPAYEVECDAAERHRTLIVRQGHDEIGTEVYRVGRKPKGWAHGDRLQPQLPCSPVLIALSERSPK